MFYYIDVQQDCVYQYSPARRKYYFLDPNITGDNNQESATYHTHEITNENIIMRSVRLHHCHTVIVHDIEKNNYFMLHVSPKEMFAGPGGIRRKTSEYIELNSYLYNQSGIGIEKNAKLELIIVVTNSKAIHDPNQICRDFKINVEGNVEKTNIIYTSALQHLKSNQCYEVEFNPNTSMVTVIPAGGFYRETYPNAFNNNIPDEVKLALPDEIAEELFTKLSNKIIEKRQLHKKATEGIVKLKFEPEFNNILTKQKGKINKGHETNIRNSIDEIENLLKQSQAPAYDLGSRALFDIYNFLVELSILIGDTVGIASYCSKVAKYSRDMRQAEHDGWARAMSAYAAAAYEALGEYQSAIEFYTISLNSHWFGDTAGQDLIRSKLNQLTKANNSNSNYSSNLESVKSESNPEPMPPVTYGVHIEEACELPISPAATTSSSEDARKVNAELSNKLRVTEELYNKAIHGLMCLNFEGHFIIILTKQTIEMHEGNKKNISKIIFEIEELLQFSQERNLDLSSENLVQTYELLIRLSQLTGDTKRIASYCGKAANYNFDNYQNEVACGRMKGICIGNRYKSQACEMSALAGAAYEALLEPQLAIKFYELCMKCNPRDHMTNPDLIPSRLNQLTSSEDIRELPKVNELSEKLKKSLELDKKATEGFAALNFTAQFTNILLKQKDEMHEGYETNISEIIEDIEKLFRLNKYDFSDKFNMANVLVKLSILIGDTERTAKYCAILVKYFYENMSQPEYEEGARIMSAYAGAACEALGETQMAIECYKIYLDSKWTKNVGDRELIRSRLYYLYENCLSCDNDSEEAREFCRNYKLTNKFNEALRLHRDATRGKNIPKFIFELIAILNKQKNEINPGYETIIDEIIEDIEKLLPQCSELKPGVDDNLAQLYGLLISLSLLTGDNESIASYCSKVAKYYFEKDRWEEALDHLAGTNVGSGYNKETTHRMSAYAGAAYEALGRYQLAIEFYELCLKCNWKHDQESTDLVRARLNKLRSSNVSNYSSNRYALLGLIKIGTQPAATAPDAETQPGNAAPNAECLKPF